jgi:phage-related minor tail protein
LTAALEGATVRGRTLSDVLRGLGTRISDLALRSAMRPLEQGLSSLISGVMPFAKGGVIASRIQPFADGGVVSAPTYFPMGGRTLGLMGEAGAEAILPLSRGADGRLGVRAAGGGGAVSVTMNVSTPDAESFRRSEAQVSAALARAVARGRRGL